MNEECETSTDGVKDHFGNVNASFVGYVNPIRYCEDCYDAEIKIHCTTEGGCYVQK